LSEAIGTSATAGFPAWFGISAGTGGGYRWIDGRAVDPAWASQRFGGNPDPNADADPANNTAHLVIAANAWSAPPQPSAPPVTHALLEYTRSKSVQGTPFDDAIFGGAGRGETVRTGAGDDSWIGTGGGKVYLGEGDDFAALRQLNFRSDWISGEVQSGTIIFDGPGRDRVEAEKGAVEASIDGDEDWFVAQRVSYADATGDLAIGSFGLDEGSHPFQVVGEAGNDRLDTLEVVGGAGNDRFVNVSRMQGGGRRR
jgi:hypothetical protein